MAPKQKLELTWIGKENRPKSEPRILLEHPEKPSHTTYRVADHDPFCNVSAPSCPVFLKSVVGLGAEDRS